VLASLCVQAMYFRTALMLFPLFRRPDRHCAHVLSSAFMIALCLAYAGQDSKKWCTDSSFSSQAGHIGEGALAIL
jgi:hypothetical protein